MSTEHRNVLETPGNSSELLRNRLESSWRLLRSTIHVTETWARRSRNAYGTFLETFSQCARSCGKTSVKGAQNVWQVYERFAKRRRKCSKRLQNLRGRYWELSPNLLEVSSNVLAKSARTSAKRDWNVPATCSTSEKLARDDCGRFPKHLRNFCKRLRNVCKMSAKRVRSVCEMWPKSDSVVGWRAEGPSGFSTPRIRGVPSLLLLGFSFSVDEEVES